MSENPIRVLVCDDHPLLREGIAALIGLESDVTVVKACASGREAIEHFRAHRPDVTLMDLQMPGMSGVEAIVTIRGEFPTARIVVLTSHAGDALVVRALKAGASGYLLKSDVHDELIDTIRRVHAGRRTVSPEVAIELAMRATEDPLTPAEVSVLHLIANGERNRVIADRLHTTEDAVKGRVKTILLKLGANDRTHAVAIGLKRGIIELS